MISTELTKLIKTQTFQRVYDFLYSVKELNITDINILSLIFNFNQTTPQCYIGQKTIADRTGICHRTVIRSLNKLEELGYLNITHRENTTNIYEINSEKMLNCIRDHNKGVCQNDTPGGDNLSRGVCHSVTRGVTICHPSISDNISAYYTTNSISVIYVSNTAGPQSQVSCSTNQNEYIHTETNTYSNKQEYIDSNNSGRLISESFPGGEGTLRVPSGETAPGGNLNKNKYSDKNIKRLRFGIPHAAKFSKAQYYKLNKYKNELYSAGLADGRDSETFRETIRHYMGIFAYGFTLGQLDHIISMEQNGSDEKAMAEYVGALVGEYPERLYDSGTVVWLESFGIPVNREHLGSESRPKEVNEDAA